MLQETKTLQTRAFTLVGVQSDKDIKLELLGRRKHSRENIRENTGRIFCPDQTKREMETVSYGTVCGV